MIYYAILTKKWIHVSIDSIKENRYLNMNFLKYSNLIFYVPLTLLMIYDYFPDSFLSDWIPIELNEGIILSLYLVSILFERFRRPKNAENINGQIFSLFYLFSVLILLTALGGNSASGIGLDNIGVWVTLAISFGEIYAQKLKSE